MHVLVTAQNQQTSVTDTNSLEKPHQLSLASSDLLLKTRTFYSFETETHTLIICDLASLISHHFIQAKGHPCMHAAAKASLPCKYEYLVRTYVLLDAACLLAN